MADVHTPEQRSFNMSRIRGRDTKPEMIVRSIVHGLGYRYRLHGRDLPGKPDLVLRRHKKIILIHGCFWHMHSCRYGRVIPKTNSAFWEKKRTLNMQRDKTTVKALKKAGFAILTVWECQTKDVAYTRKLLSDFLR